MSSVYTEDDLNLAFDILGDLLPLNYTEYTNGQISFQETRLGVAQESAALINSHVSNVVNKATADLRAQLAERDAQLEEAKEALDLALPIVKADCAEWESYCSARALNKMRKVLNNHSEITTRQPTQDKGE